MALTTQSIPEKEVAREEPKDYYFVTDELGRRSVKKVRKKSKMEVTDITKEYLKPTEVTATAIKKVKKK